MYVTVMVRLALLGTYRGAVLAVVAKSSSLLSRHCLHLALNAALSFPPQAYFRA